MTSALKLLEGRLFSGLDPVQGGDVALGHQLAAVDHSQHRQVVLARDEVPAAIVGELPVPLGRLAGQLRRDVRRLRLNTLDRGVREPLGPVARLDLHLQPSDHVQTLGHVPDVAILVNQEPEPVDPSGLAIESVLGLDLDPRGHAVGGALDPADHVDQRRGRR